MKGELRLGWARIWLAKMVALVTNDGNLGGGRAPSVWAEAAGLGNVVLRSEGASKSPKYYGDRPKISVPAGLCRGRFTIVHICMRLAL